MSYKRFKEGGQVEVADCYLEDEVTANYNTSKIATVISEPGDDEQLVMIQYKCGDWDYVPQDILEVIELKNTGILCPDCFKGKIETKDGKNGACNNCGTEFAITGPNSVRFK